MYLDLIKFTQKQDKIKSKKFLFPVMTSKILHKKCLNEAVLSDFIKAYIYSTFHFLHTVSAFKNILLPNN